MGFDFNSRSNHGSRPIYLYQFSLGLLIDDVLNYDEISWYYTNLPSDYTFQGIKYKAAPISDDGLSYTTQTQTNQFKIELPRSTEVAEMYDLLPPKCVVRVVVRQKELGDDEAPIYWVGFINGVSPSEVKTTFDCIDLVTMMGNTTGKTQWTRGCNHTLFDHNCRVDKTLFAQKLTVQSVDGHTILCPDAATKDKGYYTNGYMEWARWSERACDRMSIESHSGEKIVLGGAYNPIKAGDTVTLYPSCDLSKGSAGCARFNNISNYGGFSFMVGQSPYDGSAISTIG